MGWKTMPRRPALFLEQRPEIGLLLCCTRTHIDNHCAARIEKLLQQAIDWQYLIEKASRHKVLPLLYVRLQEIGAHAVPADVMEQLQAVFRQNTQRNLFLTRELIAVIQLLRGQGIPAVPYKGPVMAQSVYGNLSLRQMVDLDILIHPRDLFRVKELLASLGYQPYRPGVDCTPDQEAAHIQSQHEYSFVHGDTGLHLEMHWEFTREPYRLPLDLARIEDRLGQIQLAGTLVATFAPEDLLLTLCIHGTHHNWDMLCLVSDVAETIRAYPTMDWAIVFARARSLHITRILLLGLYLAHTSLDAPLPMSVSRRVYANRYIAFLGTIVMEEMLQRKRVVLSHGAAFLLTSELRDRFWNALQVYLRRFRPNERERAIVDLPAGLNGLYYPLRLIRLTREYWWGVLGPIVRFFVKKRKLN
jgi:hypothetical protein